MKTLEEFMNGIEKGTKLVINCFDNTLGVTIPYESCTIYNGVNDDSADYEFIANSAYGVVDESRTTFDENEKCWHITCDLTISEND